ncbi:hypothetical protein LEP3755_58260 [Leptolyngbya sp. NIES-3755]|nr:hypothetical protein LEP3755_58260 [Leptolyngbya sp. NIES-3755]
MKTDSLFYRFFQLAPSILFELIGEPPSTARDYEFRSVEIKQTAFRIDGVLLPVREESDRPTYFVEVQFQKDQQLYHRFFAELFLYLDQNPDTHDWQGVLIYPSRNIEPDQARLHQVLIESAKVRRIYLNGLGAVSELPLGMAIAKLVIEPEETAPEQARQLIARIRSRAPKTSQQESVPEASQQVLIDLVETIIMYKLTTLSWEEIHVMLGLDDLRQSRAYRETLEAGRQEAQREIIENLLRVRFGELDESLAQVVTTLVGMPSAEFMPLLIQLSREELIDRFTQK